MEQQPVLVGLVHPMRAWVEALEGLLAPHPGVELVVAHTDPRWVLSAVSRGEVDVVLLSAAAETGVGEVRAMREAGPRVRVVVISDCDDTNFITDVVRVGARGFLTPRCSLQELIRTVQCVAAGGTSLPPMHMTKLVESLLWSERTQQQQVDRLAPLSAREREILECLALGMRRQDIADRLFLSKHTVRTHINHVLHKLDVHSTLAAVSITRNPGGSSSDDTPTTTAC
jgi:DNA-binding NarL/FixJ family response regulator